MLAYRGEFIRRVDCADAGMSRNIRVERIDPSLGIRVGRRSFHTNPIDDTP
jgi:hypothetical protein